MNNDTFDFMAEAEAGFNAANSAPEPEGPPVDSADDFDNIPEEEKERIRENRNTYQDSGNNDFSGRTSETIKAEAKMVTGLINMAQKTACSMISGKPRDEYGIGKSEMEDFQQVTEEYLKTTQKPAMSPGQMFFLTTLSLIGPNLYRAYEDKGEVKRQKAHNEAMKRANEARTYEEAQKAKEDLEKIVKEEKEKTGEIKSKRNQFQVDANGFYRFSENGKPLKGKQKTEKAPERVLKIIREGEDMKMSDGEINSKIRFILYGSENPV